MRINGPLAGLRTSGQRHVLAIQRLDLEGVFQQCRSNDRPQGNPVTPQDPVQVQNGSLGCRMEPTRPLSLHAGVNCYPLPDKNSRGSLRASLNRLYTVGNERRPRLMQRNGLHSASPPRRTFKLKVVDR